MNDNIMWIRNEKYQVTNDNNYILVQSIALYLDPDKAQIDVYIAVKPRKRESSTTILWNDNNKTAEFILREFNKTEHFPRTKILFYARLSNVNSDSVHAGGTTRWLFE